MEKLYTIALNLRLEESADGKEATVMVPFETLPAMLDSLQPYFDEIKPRLKTLSVALQREQNVFPFHWNEGPR